MQITVINHKMKNILTLKYFNPINPKMEKINVLIFLWDIFPRATYTNR